MSRLGVLLAVCASAGATPIAAQSEERAVLAVVQQLFDGMRVRDTARMRATFHADARLAGPSVRNGEVVVAVETPDAWLKSVAGAPAGVLDERIRNPVVKIDGALASVWVDYSFYLGDRLLHCGVDAFHLVRVPAGWRILDVADTRRQEGCESAPASGRPPPA